MTEVTPDNIMRELLDDFSRKALHTDGTLRNNAHQNIQMELLRLNDPEMKYLQDQNFGPEITEKYLLALDKIDERDPQFMTQLRRVYADKPHTIPRATVVAQQVRLANEELMQKRSYTTRLSENTINANPAHTDPTSVKARVESRARGKMMPFFAHAVKNWEKRIMEAGGKSASGSPTTSDHEDHHPANPQSQAHQR